MAVYFVYRCHYNAPTEKHVRTFPEDTVLDWTRSIWRSIADDEEAYEYAGQVLDGVDVYSFGSLFTGIAADHLPPPTDIGEVVAAFEQHLYVNAIDHGPHHVQVLTDDDELDMAIYVFDDHYRAAHPGRTDWLLLDGWELPGGSADGPPPALPESNPLPFAGGGDGATYTLFLGHGGAGGNLEDLSPSSAFRIDGVRLPDLARFLLTMTDDDEPAFGHIRDGLRAASAAPGGDDAGFRAAIGDRPGDEVAWAVYSDWLQEQARPPAGVVLMDAAFRAAAPTRDRDPGKDLIHVTPHMAQACKHWGYLQTRRTIDEWWEQWVFFDDRWAAAHPALAAGILTFGTRWDVL